ncbi:DNA repair protein RecN [Desulfolucanica intricata]|uniref:DNA repair protein RecN n=1 Tax=Desulfolucanica intricata TaxID=1285191 RepID=UPI00082D0C8E|nr:DNA repair protein RecN [Desulfolucanica intricata]
MLTNLNIVNFGIISQLSLEFDKGLNVLTGETGSGKSIILDALFMALGGRASAEFIRFEQKKAQVEAVFNIKLTPEILKMLNKIGIEPEEDGTLICFREITRSGKNTCRINGHSVTLTVYRELGKLLVDIHGQHQQQSLLNIDKHRQLLDSFGGEEHLKLVQLTADYYLKWQDIHKKYYELTSNEKDKIRRIEMLQYQLNEIEKAQLKPEEDKDLESELNILMNTEKIVRLVNDSYKYLYEGESRQAAVVELLGKTINILEDLIEYVPEFGEMKSTIENMLYEIEDISRDLSEYRNNIEFNSERLNILEDRINLINRLKYKYGNTVEEILLFKQKAQIELDNLNYNQEKIGELEKSNADLELKFLDKAAELTRSRQKIAQHFQKAISDELRSLEMPNAEIRVNFNSEEYIGIYGKDKIEFLFTANPGEPLRSLTKIASGGELSRVMLALKSLLAEVDEIPTLVFDEVDSGVGGRALQAVAEKLDRISQHRQVICVTHAVPIACCASKHFKVSKQTSPNHTFTYVKELEREERIDELSRMLDGKNVTSLTKEHAKQLLNMTNKQK